MGIKKLLVIALLMGPATTWGEVIQELDSRITEGVQCAAEEVAQVSEVMENQLVAAKLLEWGVASPAADSSESAMTVEVDVTDCMSMKMTWIEEPPKKNTSISWHEVEADVVYTVGNQKVEDYFFGIVKVEDQVLKNEAKSSSASPVPGDPGSASGWPDAEHPWPEKANPLQPKKGEFFNI